MVLRGPAQAGLAALFMMGVMATGIEAQPLTGTAEATMASAQGTIPAAQEAALIGLLGSSLQSLSEKARRDRMTGGYVMLGIGIASGIGGAATLAFGEGDDARIVGYSLLGAGALLGGLSLLPFKLISEPERMHAEFSTMSADTPDQTQQKFYYWDRRFEEFARKSRNERIIGGISSIIVGLTSYLYVEGTDEDRVHALIWPAFGGVTLLLVKSEGERRYETYQRAKEDITGLTRSRAIDFRIAPLLDGGIFGAVRIRF